MLISIDTVSERPIYAQIADSVRRSVASGTLSPGDKLPPAAEVAASLGVNKHTVLHAYQALRDERLVELRRGRGAVVTPLASEVVAVQSEAAMIAERARALGISAHTLLALFGESPGGNTAARPEARSAVATRADADADADATPDPVVSPAADTGAASDPGADQPQTPSRVAAREGAAS